MNSAMLAAKIALHLNLAPRELFHLNGDDGRIAVRILHRRRLHGVRKRQLIGQLVFLRAADLGHIHHGGDFILILFELLEIGIFSVEMQ